MTCRDCIGEMTGRFKLLMSATTQDTAKAEIEFVLMKTALNDRSIDRTCRRCLADFGLPIQYAWNALQDCNPVSLTEHLDSARWELDCIIDERLSG